MDVIAVIAQKGGTGKTTLTLALAVAAQLAGKVTAIVDLDPQASASNWSDRREMDSPVVVSAQPARLPHVLTSAEASGAALVLIDTPPRAEQAALAAAKAAHLILIGCPSHTDEFPTAFQRILTFHNTLNAMFLK
jgi:chromosome partitioning protein